MAARFRHAKVMAEQLKKAAAKSNRTKGSTFGARREIMQEGSRQMASGQGHDEDLIFSSEDENEGLDEEEAEKSIT